MSITIREVGPNKVAIIRIYRELTGLGLKEAKEAIDSVAVKPLIVCVADEDTAVRLLQEAGAEAVKNQMAEKQEAEALLHRIQADEIERSLDSEPTPTAAPEPTSEKTSEAKKTTEAAREQWQSFQRIEADEVALLDRNELMDVLDEMRQYTLTMDRFADQILDANAQIEVEKKKAQEIREQISDWVVWGTLGVGVVSGIICLFFLSWFGIIAGIFFAVFSWKQIFFPLDKTLNQKKRDEEATQYLVNAIRPLNARIRELDEKIFAVKTSKAGRWAIDVVGEELFNTESLTELIAIVKSRRADTLKEVLNKYDSSLHTSKMEEMQRAIQNASEMTAEEAAMQTVYARETAKSAHQTATASMASAYHTRQIARNTKAIKRTINGKK